MDVFLCPASDELGKFEGVVEAFPQIWDGSILDVGCRSGNLRSVIDENGTSYCGFDLFPPADVLGNVEAGLPFESQRFDTVVALDILEHTNDIHAAFLELCRVGRKYVVIALPNLYEFRIRLRILLGRRIGKYVLAPDRPEDRHRWFFSFNEARDFVHGLAETIGFTVVSEGCLVGPRAENLLVRNLVGRRPNLFSRWYLALLSKDRTGNISHRVQ